MTEHREPSRLARLVTASSELANRHGLYLGPRATKLHVALYRLSGGNLGGHIPGWPDARILLLDHTGAKTGRQSYVAPDRNAGDRTIPVVILEPR